MVTDSGTAFAAVRSADVRLLIRGLDPPLAREGRISADGTFDIAGLAGVVEIAAAAPGWSVQQVSRNGTELPDRVDLSAGDVTGIEIVLTRKVNTFDGRVRGLRNEPTNEATVIVFAEDAERRIQRFIRRARPERDGRFRVTGLPDGRYLAVAVDVLEIGQELDRETLETLSSKATRVVFRDGSVQVLELTVVTQP
jgi:hypothetical protein